MPYALLVAGVSAVAYVVEGFIANAWIALPIALAMMAGVLLLIKLFQNISAKKAAK